MYQTLKLFLLAILLLTGLTACREKMPPEAVVIAHTGHLLTGQTITFIPSDVNAHSMRWDFGDGAVSGETMGDQTHVYTTPGQYTVEVTATNSDGSTSSSITIEIKAFPKGVKIHKVHLVKSNLQNNWDPGTATGPDIFFRVTDDRGTVVIGNSTTYPDVALSDIPLIWTTNNPTEITFFDLGHSLKFYDNDGPNSAELMSLFNFKFIDQAPFEVNTIELTNINYSQSKALMEVEYIY